MKSRDFSFELSLRCYPRHLPGIPLKWHKRWLRPTHQQFLHSIYIDNFLMTPLLDLSTHSRETNIIVLEVSSSTRAREQRAISYLGQKAKSGMQRTALRFLWAAWQDGEQLQWTGYLGRVCK